MEALWKGKERKERKGGTERRQGGGERFAEARNLDEENEGALERKGNEGGRQRWTLTGTSQTWQTLGHYCIADNIPISR